MTADDIRARTHQWAGLIEKTNDADAATASGIVYIAGMLGEIAAQLSELNERLRSGKEKNNG